MKIKQILFAVGAAFLLAACTGNENIENEQKKTVEIENITITEEPFEPEAPSTTRAAQASQIVDLGDGITAEVSLTEDAQEQPAQTRAAIADGHYTIYASIPGGAMPNTGVLKAELSGTVHGGKFVRDASSSPMHLAPGTYTFVCINDAFPKVGNEFELTNDLNNPLMATVTMPISGNAVTIPFVMKHRDTSRVRFQITSYTNEGQGITGKLSFSTGSAHKHYDIEGRYFAGSGGSFTSGTYTFAESAVTPSAYTQTIKRTTDYRYFLSGTQGLDAQFTIDGGTIYGKSLAGKSFPLTAISNLQENKSYTCNIKLKPSLLYLFQDGTVGVLADKGTRTPIGIVVKEKTTTEKGLAIALKDAGQGLSWAPDNVKANDVQIEFDTATGVNPAYSTNMGGYRYTWEKSGSGDGNTVKGETPIFSVFYAAAQYNPGVTVTGNNVSKWFLPSTGEFRLFFINVGKYQWLDTERFSETGKGNNTAPYFTQAGGTAISYDNATSTEGTALTAANVIWNLSPGQAAIASGYERNRSDPSEWHVRSFVHF